MKSILTLCARLRHAGGFAATARKQSFVSFLMLAATMLASTTLGAAPPPGIPDGWSDGFVYANGIRIHYYHATPAPGKPVIVMVHGVTDIGLCWTTLTWKLQDAYDIYMVDTRGHGRAESRSRCPE